MTEVPPFGYVVVSRKVFDAEHGDPLWLEARAYSRWEAWIDLIQLAAWKESNYRTKYGVIRLQRGEFVASIRGLGVRWGWNTKRVRLFLAALLKGGRIRAHQTDTKGHSVGTVYLIVKYDAYQGGSVAKGTPKGTPEGNPRAQQGHKIEAVKAVSTSGDEGPSAEPAPPPAKRPRAAAGAAADNLDAFPKATCDAGFERWVSRIGAMHYGRFRAALLPLFRAKPCCYDGPQLADAVEAFYDAKSADAPAFQGKWTVNRFAAELHQWVRLGAMDLVDEWGMPTDRGRAAKVFAA